MGRSAPTAVVALDGPSGSGKSTVARRVAGALGWAYVDTGATYRAATLAVLRAGVDLADAERIAEVVRSARVVLRTDPAHPGVELDGADVSAEVRGAEVTAAVSAVSAVPEVRHLLVALQQDLIGSGEAVVEGRDISAVVAPGAAVKVYLDADHEVRAARRATDVDAGVQTRPGTAPVVVADLVSADLARRDALDSNRAASPLAAAPDAVVIDATHLSAEEVTQRVLALAAEAGWDPR